MRTPASSSSSSSRAVAPLLLGAAALLLLLLSSASLAAAAAAAFTSATTRTPPPSPGRGRGIPLITCRGSSGATSSGRLPRPIARPSTAQLLASPSSPPSSSDDDDASSTTATTTTSGKETKKSRRRRTAILLCPAQFCVPADYATLLDDMRARARDDPTSEIDIVAARVAPLPRTEWIKVARQLPTRDFLDATLSSKTTLGWYFDAIETALSDLFAEAAGGGGGGDDDLSVCVVGHSIGGWVARAYLGGLSGSSTSVHRLALRRVSSLITLGTPHSSPDSALVDQTRGLLREVGSHPGCSSASLSDGGRVGITCVTSSGIVGKVLTSNVEELVASASYLPLVGRIGPDVGGDGIVPAELAVMEHPARAVVIDGCSVTGAAVRHAHVLPTPWNLVDGYAPSWELPGDIIWYGSPGVLGQWLRYIE